MFPGFTPDPQLIALMNQVQTGTNQEAIDAAVKMKEIWVNSGLEEAEGTFIRGELDWAIQTLSSSKLALPQLTQHVRARVMQVGTMIAITQTEILSPIAPSNIDKLNNFPDLSNVAINDLDTELEKIFAPPAKNKLK